MVRKMKLRFVLTAVLAMALTLGIAFGAVNILLRRELTERTDYIIELIHKNGGEIPIYEKYYYGLHSQTPYETRYYVALLDKNNVVIGLNSEHIYFAGPNELTNQLTAILRTGKNSGYMDDYRFGVYKTDLAKMVIVVDCRTDRNTNDFLMKITIYTVAVCLAAAVIILLMFSGNIVKPYVQNREKQRRFITDAGHELKTPIAIISANTEVLEMTEGENEWLSNIKSQTVRLNQLVRNMIDLSKMDEDKKEETQRILYTDIVCETVNSFSVYAEKDGVSIKASVEENVYINGRQEELIRLTGILIDNAIKYADDRKQVVVSLVTKGRKAVFKVTNTCSGVDRETIPHFFDRFYRADSSRSRETGGYGIGLSMAKAICDKNKYRIAADYTKDERIAMTVQFNL